MGLCQSHSKPEIICAQLQVANRAAKRGKPCHDVLCRPKGDQAMPEPLLVQDRFISILVTKSVCNSRLEFSAEKAFWKAKVA